MPKPLCNRLEDLENEIRVLLTLQEDGTGGCQRIRGKSITKQPDGNIEHIEFEGSACPKPTSCCSKPPPCPKPPTCCPKPQSPCGPKPTVCPRPHLCGPKPTCGGDKPKSCSPDRHKSPCCRPPQCIAPKPRYPTSCPYHPKPPPCTSPCPPPCPLPCPPPCDARQPCVCAQPHVEDDNCFEELEKLQAELKCMQKRMGKCEKEKLKAQQDAAEAKANLDQLQDACQKAENDLKKMQEDNAALLNELDSADVEKQNLAQQALAAIATQKNQVKKVSRHAAKTTRRSRCDSVQLASVVEKKDTHIRKLSETTGSLLEKIEEKEREMKKLEEMQKEALKNLFEAQQANKLLAEQNACLIKSIKELQDKLIAEKNCVQRLMKHIEQCRVESCRLREEVERLRTRLRNTLEGPKEIRRLARLEDKLKVSREREQLWLDEAAVMEARLKELEKSQENAEINYEDELDQMYRQNKKLQVKYDQAMKDLEQLRRESEQTINELRKEFETVTSDLRKKNILYLEQKKKAECEVELANANALFEKKKGEELANKVKYLETVVENQKTLITQKDMTIAQLLKVNSALKERVAKLNSELKALRDAIHTLNCTIKQLEAEIDRLKTDLERARSDLEEKDKQIAEYINQVENLSIELHETEAKMKTALEEAEAAAEALKVAQEEISDLNGQVEAALNEANTAKLALDAAMDESNPCKDSEIIPQLQRKIELLERKNELQIELMSKEKDQAIYAAKFATERLLQTVNDFQNQSCIHKKIQLVLSHLLQEKEEQIRGDPKCMPCGMPIPPEPPAPPRESCCARCPNSY
ncbi:hypothetical protein FQR65_LT07465 [Abscondita terminalis]|nr:hypothetical protein FQR65_LT07465 [Abscondita terminalis]